MNGPLRCGALAALAFCMTACSGSKVDAEAAARGKTAAQACVTCHSFGSDHRIGPHLRKVMGRTAGTVAGYEFSAAMRASGIVWTEESMREFLQAPLQRVPGTKMALTPLNAAQARDVVEYIKSQD